MELFALLFALMFIAALDEGRFRRRVYPPGECEWGDGPVHFNWKTYAWVHSMSGMERAPTAGIPGGHFAYPTHRKDTAAFLPTGDDE